MMTIFSVWLRSQRGNMNVTMPRACRVDDAREKRATSGAFVVRSGVMGECEMGDGQ